jgi:hypothetical protein
VAVRLAGAVWSVTVLPPKVNDDWIALPASKPMAAAEIWLSSNCSASVEGSKDKAVPSASAYQR